MADTIFTLNEQGKIQEIVERYLNFLNLNVKPTKEMVYLIQQMDRQYKTIKDNYKAEVKSEIWETSVELLLNMHRFEALMLGNWDKFVALNPEHHDVISKVLKAIN